MSGRRARGAGAGTLPRGAEPGRRRARAGQGSGGGRSGGLRGRSRSPQPRAGVRKAPELLWKCRDAWTRRLRAPAPPAAPLRLPAAASAPAGGRRCLLAGRAAGVRALVVPPPPPLLRWPLWLSDGPPPSAPKATSLRSNDLYIPGWVLPNATRSPRRGEGARGEPGGGRGRSAGAERRAPPAPTRELVASSCFPGSAESAPRSRRVPKALSPRPGSAAVWRLCQRFHDKTRRKKRKCESNRLGAATHSCRRSWREVAGRESGTESVKGAGGPRLLKIPGRGDGEVAPEPPGSECPLAEASNGRFRFFSFKPLPGSSDALERG